MSGETSAADPDALGVDMKLEVVTVPVSDVDRAKAFYESLGWRLDIDLVVSDELRTVQLTPPHSECSIHFGKGLTETEPGSLDSAVPRRLKTSTPPGTIWSAAASRSARFTSSGPRVRARRGRSYFAYASFSDPDGNGWLLQEITARLPVGNGRTEMDVASLADLLHETSGHHGAFEAVAPPHDWWDWYAAYMDARQSGSTPEDASAAAGRYMAEVKDVVVASA